MGWRPETSMNITQHHNFPQPPPVLFRALTDAATLCTWWTTTAESDANIGGLFRYEFRHTPEAIASGKLDMVQEGKYIECDVNAIEYAWMVGSHSSLVRFVLTPDGEGTALKLMHTELPDDQTTIDMLAAGWEFFLGNLQAVLSGEGDQRPAFGLVAT